MTMTRTHIVGRGRADVWLCCEPMASALGSGTDSEGYASFASVDANGTVRLSCCNLPPHRFCPWCGGPAVASFTEPGA